MLSDNERGWIIQRVCILIYELISNSEDYRAKEIRELMNRLKEDKQNG